MEKYEVVVIDPEQLALLMAHALHDLQCPECCGPIYEFIEFGAQIYREEWEWACLFTSIGRARFAK